MGPEATIVSKDRDSAPRFLICFSSSHAISFSVIPGLMFSDIVLNELSAISIAFCINFISSSSFVDLRLDTILGVGIHLNDVFSFRKFKFSTVISSGSKAISCTCNPSVKDIGQGFLLEIEIISNSGDSFSAWIIYLESVANLD